MLEALTLEQFPKCFRWLVNENIYQILQLWKSSVNCIATYCTPIEQQKQSPCFFRRPTKLWWNHLRNRIPPGFFHMLPSSKVTFFDVENPWCRSFSKRLSPWPRRDASAIGSLWPLWGSHLRTGWDYDLPKWWKITYMYVYIYIFYMCVYVCVLYITYIYIYIWLIIYIYITVYIRM